MTNVSPEGKVQWGHLVGDRPDTLRQSDQHEHVTGEFLLQAAKCHVWHKAAHSPRRGQRKARNDGNGYDTRPSYRRIAWSPSMVRGRKAGLTAANPPV